MKKLDKLVLSSFTSTLTLTFCIVVFILLNRHLLYYYDDIIGKDLGALVIAKFIGYFSIFIFPHALPLSILLASLICFGTLGEHMELTAMKAAGISLTRVIRPVLVLIIIISIAAFGMNNLVVPKAALNAFTLLYDIKQKKPALDIRAGEFYTGLDHVSIKVDKKYPNDPAALGNVLLYDHNELDRNTDVYVADSGRMTTIFNEQFLRFELFNGYNYKEEIGEDGARKENASRMRFARMEILVDLSGFSMKPTDANIFAGHRYMKNLSQLQSAIETRDAEIFNAVQNRSAEILAERARATQSMAGGGSELGERSIITSVLNRAREQKSKLENYNAQLSQYRNEANAYRVQWHRILSYSFACLTMFLVGAPLGAIIKKGGLGIPVLISIGFFIVFFVLDMQGEKLSNRGVIPTAAGMWAGNTFLFSIALILLNIARVDGRLLEGDFYNVLFQRLQFFRKSAGELPG